MVLLQLLENNCSPETIRASYSKFTNVEKVIYDRKILENQNYPNFYWKIIAAIYFMIFKKLPPPVKISEVKNSIEELYLKFSSFYRPFKRDIIDSKLKNLGYSNELINSTKDKIILYIRNMALENNFHPIEKELTEYPSFLISIDFLSFFPGLLFFSQQPVEHIPNFLSFNRIIKESTMFKERLEETNEIPGKILYEIVLGFNKNSYNRTLVALNKIITNKFDIRFDDFLLILEFCRYFFDLHHANTYIMDILMVMKHREVPISIVMLFDKVYAFEYFKMKPTTEYMAEHGNNINLLDFKINSDNYMIVAAKCNSFRKFRTVFNYIVEKGYEDQVNCMRSFIANTTDPEFHIEFPQLKYDILACYIRNCRINDAYIFIGRNPDINVVHPMILKALGESCSLKIYNVIYGDIIFDYPSKRIIVNESIKKGSFVFRDLFMLPISEAEILELVGDSNSDLIIKSELKIDATVVNDFLAKVIVNGNSDLFHYVLSINDPIIFNMDKLILLAALNERPLFLYKLVSLIHEDNDQLFLSVLNHCCDVVSYEILNILFKKLSFSFKDLQTQLTTMRYIIGRITKTKNKSWLKDNLHLLPIYDDSQIDYVEFSLIDDA